MSAYSCADCADASAYRCPVVTAAAAVSCGRSSTNVFHLPQSSHLPSHFGACAPHSWQTKTVFGALLILPFDARAHATDDFPRNRADGGGHLAGVDAIAALRSENHGLVARKDFHAGDVHRQHVHRHRADDRSTAAADEDVTAAGETKIEAVGIAGGN